MSEETTVESEDEVMDTSVLDTCVNLLQVWWGGGVNCRKANKPKYPKVITTNLVGESEAERYTRNLTLPSPQLPAWHETWHVNRRILRLWGGGGGGNKNFIKIRTPDGGRK